MDRPPSGENREAVNTNLSPLPTPRYDSSQRGVTKFWRTPSQCDPCHYDSRSCPAFDLHTRAEIFPCLDEPRSSVILEVLPEPWPTLDRRPAYVDP